MKIVEQVFNFEGARATAVRYPIYALALLTLANFLNYIDRQVLPAVAPLMLRDPKLGLSDAELGYIEASLLLSFTLFAPLFGLLGTGNKPEGFDVAIGALIAAKLGIPFDSIKFKETPSNIRETAIQNGDVDIVSATYTISDKRKQLIDFAGPYFLAGQAIMVLSSDNTINTPEDLKGKPVCSVQGSTPAATIVDKYGATLVATDVYSNCLDPLRNKQVVAVTTDNVILSGFVAKNGSEFKLANGGKTFTDEPYGIGLKKGDQAFRDFINTVLEDSYKDGTWARLFKETAGKVLPVPDPPKVNRY